MQSKESKALLTSYWLLKMLYLKSNLIVRKRYTFDNHKKMQTILSKYQISLLQLDNDIAKSIYKEKNILASQTIE